MGRSSTVMCKKINRTFISIVYLRENGCLSRKKMVILTVERAIFFGCHCMHGNFAFTQKNVS
ncbi:hypothetical protein EY693_00380 [Enterococcus casseliflavus]|uniref:Uncharacterized protein n=1 Tax=Enterococcus casseliflavus TaxID=37734 RepID=A0A415EU05_ENTCA|nr:hypothetical protein D8N35_13675 [Enterococcus casseliflavus]EEV28854.1 predicted protein [Enterococcus casseliflavus EC30]EEV35188.1 predicted protein [Enterococcus casseliflavus EC10]MBO6383942.1 hypothetical protein [Enterococcus faecalis]HCO71997.1 hypothetical protein [Enterococcus sp.]